MKIYFFIAIPLVTLFSNVLANEVIVDRFDRDIGQLEKLPPLRDSSMDSLMNPMATTSEVSDFVVGSSYKPGQTDIGSVAFGDIDGDGDQELIAVSSYYFDEVNDYSAFIFHPSEQGLGVPVQVSYDATAYRNGLSITDLDNDGVDEIIVGHGQGITIIQYDGFGGFDKHIMNSAAADTLDALDIDLDGKMDLIGLPWASPANQYFGDGNASISMIESLDTNASGYNDQAIGDLNSDGINDFVSMSGQLYATPNFSVHLHNTIDGLSSADGYFVGVNELTGGLGIGDINGDGRDDIVLSRPRNSPTHLWVYTQEESGNLSSPTQLASYDIPETIRIADLNGDGFEDILVLHGGWTTLGVYLNDADGLGEEIRVPIPYASHYAPEGLALGDLNLDGCPEMIAIADYNYGVVPVTHNLCPESKSITEQYEGTIKRNTITWPISTSASGTIELLLVHQTNRRRNVDMFVYDANDQLLYQSTSTTNPDLLVTNILPVGDYRVDLVNQRRKRTDYTLQVTHY